MPLDASNDSEAHIIPNALGGRLKPKGIICRDCNTKLDELADNALVEAFGDWPTLLDLPRDRGGNPVKLVGTRKGRKVYLSPDGSMTRADVVYEEREVSDGHSLTIGAGDMKTIRNLLKRAEKRFKEQYPHFDAKVAEQHAKTVDVKDDDELRFRFDFSPQAVFGGVATAIWLYLINETGRAFMDWDGLLRYVAVMQRNGGTFRYLVDGLPGLKGPQIDLGHKIVVRSVPSTGELIAYMEILGVLKVGGLFAKSPAPAMPLEYIYAYDIVAKADRSAEFTVDEAVFEHQSWKTVGLGPTDADALKEHFRNALQTFVEHYERRFAEDEAEG